MKEVKTNLTFSTWIGHTPLRLGIEEGIFKKNGIEAITKSVTVGAHEEREQMLLKGEVDFVAQSVPSAIRLISNNPGCGKILFLECYSPGSDGIVAKDYVRTVKDLVKRKVAFKRGVYQFYVGYILKKQGLSFEDITSILSSSGEEMRDKFLNNEVDAVSIWEPFLTELSSSKNAHKLVTTREDFGDMFSVFIVRSNFLREQPGIVDKVIKAYFESVKFVEKNRDKVIEFHAEDLKIDMEKAQRIVKDFEFLTQEKNKIYFDRSRKDNIFEVVKISAEVAKDMGNIKTILDPKSYFDMSYIENL